MEIKFRTFENCPSLALLASIRSNIEIFLKYFKLEDK